MSNRTRYPLRDAYNRVAVGKRRRYAKALQEFVWDDNPAAMTTLPYLGERSSINSISIDTLQPLNEPGDPPYQGYFLYFVETKRQQLRQGWDVDTVIGPDRVDVAHVLSNKCYDRTSGYHRSISQWAAEIVKSFDVDITVKLAYMVVLVRLMRVSGAWSAPRKLADGPTVADPSYRQAVQAGS